MKSSWKYELYSWHNLSQKMKVQFIEEKYNCYSLKAWSFHPSLAILLSSPSSLPSFTGLPIEPGLVSASNFTAQRSYFFYSMFKLVTRLLSFLLFSPPDEERSEGEKKDDLDQQRPFRSPHSRFPGSDQSKRIGQTALKVKRFIENIVRVSIHEWCE